MRYSGVVPVTHCDCEKGCSDFLFHYEKEAKNQPKDNRAHNTPLQANNLMAAPPLLVRHDIIDRHHHSW